MLRGGQVIQLTVSSVLWTCHNFEDSKHTRVLLSVFCCSLKWWINKQGRFREQISSFGLSGPPQKILQNDTCKVRETDTTRKLYPPIVKYSTSGGSMLLRLSSPVALLSSWQQQRGSGCAGARRMLRDYMH